MASLNLPRPVAEYAIHEDRSLNVDKHAAEQAAIRAANVPRYRERTGYVPRKAQDFGDGGAFPEIHVAQYPLGMGRKSSGKTSSTLALTVDKNDGKVEYDAVVTRRNGGGAGSNLKLHTRYEDLVAQNSTAETNSNLALPNAAEEEASAAATAAALGQIVGRKLEASRAVKTIDNRGADQSIAKPKYIAYKPQGSGGKQNGDQSRVIRMYQGQEDPLELARFKHKKAPRAAPTEAPAPIMHSVSKKASAKEKADWTIPPMISSWKNPKGFTIPLDKRLAADGKGLAPVQVNDRFAGLSEALYIAENQARQEVEARNREKQFLLQRDQEKKNEEMLAKAAQVRAEQMALAPSSDGRARSNSAGSAATANSADTLPGERPGKSVGDQPGDIGATLGGHDRGEAGTAMGYGIRERELERDEAARNKMRSERKREREQAVRLEVAGKKSKLARDKERDVSEKIALGMAVPRSALVSGEDGYDSRLFNQSEGLTSGFGNDDEYNVYSAPLFNQDKRKGGLYRPKAESDRMALAGSNVEEQLEQLKRGDRFAKEGSVEADVPPEDGFAALLKGGSRARKAGDRIDKALEGGRRGAGYMAAAAGGGGDPRQGSGRKRIAFDQGESDK